MLALSSMSILQAVQTKLGGGWSGEVSVLAHYSNTPVLQSTLLRGD
jgi:hypothetical protein